MIHSTVKLPTKQFPELRGYYCIQGKTLYCPAIYVTIEGRGYLREFVVWAKENFDCVKFPSLISPKLEYILVKKYGFSMTQELHEMIGEYVPVAVWEKEVKKNE